MGIQELQVGKLEWITAQIAMADLALWEIERLRDVLSDTLRTRLEMEQVPVDPITDSIPF